MRTAIEPEPLAQSIYRPDRVAPVLNAVCHYHRQLQPAFICSACGAAFCRRCTKIVGSASAGICGLCDSLCLPYTEVREQVIRLADQHLAFGLTDFWFALRFPFQQSITVAGLGILFGATLFSLPFYTLAEVGVLLGSIGLLPAFIGSALMFGFACLVINRVEAGARDSRHVFDASKLLADLWEVAILGFGIFLATGFPALLAWKLFNSLPFWVPILWAIFYYPMALQMAASTQCFLPVLNILSGIGTMWQMRAVYLKFFLLYLCALSLAGAMVVPVILIVLPVRFHLILFLTLGTVIGPPIFYANMVIACLIGRMLFKRGEAS